MFRLRGPHRGAGVIIGPKAGQRLQVPGPRDPPALPGHVRRAVTQDPSRVEHAAATVLRVSVISDQGALTVTLHRPLAAAHSCSEAPCTGRGFAPVLLRAGGTDAPLLRPHSPPHWWTPWVWREDPRPRPGCSLPSRLQSPSCPRFSRGPSPGEDGATGREAPRPGLGPPGHQGRPGQHHPPWTDGPGS